MARDHLQSAISLADEWITRQDRVRRVLFTRINEAVQRGRDLEVRTLVPQVNELLKHDKAMTAEEAAVFDSAQALLREARRRPDRPQRPASQARPGTKLTRAEREARRTALAQARSLICRLRVKGILPRRRNSSSKSWRPSPNRPETCCP
ncbi:hypothetical protein [Streptomyces sp. NPDC127092]